MSEEWAKFGKAVFEQSPLFLLFILVLVGAYFFHKNSLKEIRQYSEKAIEEIRQAYDRADSRRA